MKSFREHTAVEENLSEDFDFVVKVEGLPDMYVKAKTPSEIKNNLRKILKYPDTVISIDRLQPTDIKKIFRAKAAGTETDD